MGINESTNISDEIKEMRDTDNLNKGWW
jgi:hypothetical protein